MKKIILAGGSGYLGNELARYFQTRADEIIIVSRSCRNPDGNIRQVFWDGKNGGEWTNELESTDLIINLAGKSVNCRYTKRNKNEIYSSRIDSTNAIGRAIANCKTPPKAWINSSSVTIYEASFDANQTETNGKIGDDFSMDVCQKWEAAFNSFRTPLTRKIIIRTSIVLGQAGGAMIPLTNIVKAGFGGSQGNGRQFVSWIHERDFCRAIEWLNSNEKAFGIYNVVSTNNVRNADFMRCLCESLGAKWGIPISEFLLKVSAVFVGTETELVLKSRKVYPERLLNEGFVFEFSDLKEALDNLCRLEAGRT